MPSAPAFVFFVAFCEMDGISAAVSRFPGLKVSKFLGLSASSVTSCKMPWVWLRRLPRLVTSGLASGVSMQIVGASLLAMLREKSPASRLLHQSPDGVLVYERGRGSLNSHGLARLLPRFAGLLLERLQRGTEPGKRLLVHAVDEKHSVEMVDLVLDAA